jgi:hypothetical protein
MPRAKSNSVTEYDYYYFNKFVSFLKKQKKNAIFFYRPRDATFLDWRKAIIKKYEDNKERTIADPESHLKNCMFLKGGIRIYFVAVNECGLPKEVDKTEIFEVAEVLDPYEKIEASSHNEEENKEKIAKEASGGYDPWLLPILLKGAPRDFPTFDRTRNEKDESESDIDWNAEIRLEKEEEGTPRKKRKVSKK